MTKLEDKEACKLMEKWNIPLVKQSLVKNEKEAINYAEKLGYPVVMKISSKDIIHKTDMKGIFLNIKNGQEVSKTFNKIIKNTKKHFPKAKIDGVLVQEMVNGYEVIVGSKYDEQFGPVLMFGMGGIFTELLHDVTFRIMPVRREDVSSMIKEIKTYSLLNGFRGQKKINFKALEDCLLNVSNMVWNNRKIKELDINPLFVNDKNVLAADVRIITD